MCVTIKLIFNLLKIHMTATLVTQQEEHRKLSTIIMRDWLAFGWMSLRTFTTVLIQVHIYFALKMQHTLSLEFVIRQSFAHVILVLCLFRHQNSRKTFFFYLSIFVAIPHLIPVDCALL